MLLRAGAGSILTQVLDLGADVWLGYDDYFRQVRVGGAAADLGVPYMVVNHGALEEWGVRNLGPVSSSTSPACPYTSCGRAACTGFWPGRG